MNIPPDWLEVIDSSSLHIKTITFDNPKAGYTNATNKANVETYLNQPNVVNAAGL